MAKPKRKKVVSNAKSNVASSNVAPGDAYAPVDQAIPDDDQNVNDLLAQHNGAWEFLWPVRRQWWDRERLLITHLADSYSRKSTRSHVTDGHLSTLVFERQARVAAQLPTGTVYSLDASKRAEESAMLMNLVLNKYILPNANSQFDALTKLRMSGVYASVYGAQPILYDYRIDDEYIGPDFWLIPARNFVPQPWKNSIGDCDWVMVSTIVSVSFLEDIVKRQKTSWNKTNLQKLIDLAKEGTTPEKDLDMQRKSEVQNIREFSWSQSDQGRSARVELITKYEKGKKGRWITFARDYKDVGVLRNIPNPHKSGRIPIVMRQCFPLVDSIWGLGDFERGISLQKAKDSLINLYLEGVKLSIFPPLKIDATVVTSSSITMQAGARWLMKDLNAVQPFQVSPEGMTSFQGTYQFLTGALLNQFGTADTSVSKADSGNPAFGKTPEALQMLQERESARDNWDRFMLEKTIEPLWEGMLNLLSENQEKPIDFHIFDADIKQLQKEFGNNQDNTDQPDQDELPSYVKKVGQNVAKVSLTKSLISGKYKYIIDASSTMRSEEDDQNEILLGMLQFYFANPQVIDQYLKQDGYQFNAGEAIKKAIYVSGIQDPDTIVSKMPNNGQPGAPLQINPETVIQNMGSDGQDPDLQAAIRKMFGDSNPAAVSNQQPQAAQQQPNLQSQQPQVGVQNG